MMKNCFEKKNYMCDLLGLVYHLSCFINKHDKGNRSAVIIMGAFGALNIGKFYGRLVNDRSSREPLHLYKFE